jgi:DNA processing protein
MRALPCGGADYPERLSVLAAPPPTLWVQGRWPLAGRPVVALVGSRAASRTGMARAEVLGAELARAGALVVSGGAIGIDAAAHRGALLGRGPTLAIVAPGLDNPYPEQNRPLFDQILRQGGALASMVPPGAPVQKWHFPARNHVIAALADAVVVVECGARSGSTITARAAATLGKKVAACRGSLGTDQLIAAGAAPIDSAADLLALVAGRRRVAEGTPPPVDTPAAKVYSVLDGREARGLDRLCAAAGLPVPTALSALCELELAGLALAVPGGRYLRAATAPRTW